MRADSFDITVFSANLRNFSDSQVIVKAKAPIARSLAERKRGSFNSPARGY